ncbi:hypothetical protein GNP86_04955 [Aliivibrio fischeri]|nr:hypothetical protein [Aliivibrio fischeri]
MERSMSADVNIIYKILCLWGKPKTYADLSSDYKRHTNEWYSPHSWEKLLNELNIILSQNGAPPLSALVVSLGTNEPKLSFWAGGASNVPALPNNPLQRTLLWQSLVNDINHYSWPSQLTDKKE